MSKSITAVGALVGAAVWFLLFVILGFGLGTSFIAGGSALGAALLAALMASSPVRAILDVPVRTSGVLVGVATFVIMAVVLSIPLWIDVTAAVGATGVVSVVEALVGAAGIAEEAEASLDPDRAAYRSSRSPLSNHRRRSQEPLGAR